MSKGFVYVLSNVALPGLVKIGFSTKVPTERALELDTTGVPSPFEVEYYCLVERAAFIEQAVHTALSEHRYRAEREFFRLDIETAVAALESTAFQAEHRWRRTPKARVRPPYVMCDTCGARYVSAVYCHKCRTTLRW